MFEGKNPSGDGLEWIDTSRKFAGTRNERLRIQELEKKKISVLAASLVVGFQSFKIHKDGPPRDLENQVLRSILDLIKNESLRFKLHGFWKNGQRTVFLDAGTTTQILAESFLQYLTIPLDGLLPSPLLGNNSTQPHSINKIEIITNDRPIFNCLGDVNVAVKTIMIGGRQQFRGNSIAGLMAENFLRVNDIQAGMAIVSATSVRAQGDPSATRFFAENEHFASMKRQFLDRSQIRIMIADSSKFTDNDQAGDCFICNAKNSGIDLLLTDSADSATIEKFEKFGVALIGYDQLIPKPKVEILE